MEAGSILVKRGLLTTQQLTQLRQDRPEATRLDVVLEQVLAEVPALKLAADEPALLGGWFRRARLVKN